MLIDVVSSYRSEARQIHGIGVLLVLACYLVMCRSRTFNTLCTVAVTAKGKGLFESLGFEAHDFTSGGARVSLFYISANELQMGNIQNRLKMNDNNLLRRCWRRGATARTIDKRMPLCY